MFYLKETLSLAPGIYSTRPEFTQFMENKHYNSTVGVVLCEGVVISKIGGHALRWVNSTGQTMFTNPTGVGQGWRVMRPAGRMRSGRAALMTGELVEVLHADQHHTLVSRKKEFELCLKADVIHISDARFCEAAQSEHKFSVGMKLHAAMTSYMVSELTSYTATLTLKPSKGKPVMPQLVCELHKTPHTEIITVPLAHSNYYIAAQDFKNVL